MTRPWQHKYLAIHSSWSMHMWQRCFCCVVNMKVCNYVGGNAEDNSCSWDNELVFFNPSSPGRRLEFVVAVVLLLCDLWRGADHQNPPLQRSRASAGRQGLRGQRQRDPGVPCWPLSQWVEPTWTQQQHLHYSCTYDIHPSFLRPRRFPKATFFLCVLDWPPAALSGNVNSKQHNMFPPVPLKFQIPCLPLGSFDWGCSRAAETIDECARNQEAQCQTMTVFPFSWRWLGTMVPVGDMLSNVWRRSQKSHAWVQQPRASVRWQEMHRKGQWQWQL